MTAPRGDWVKTGRRPPPEAARSGLEQIEHGARLIQVGHSRCRIMVLSAACLNMALEAAATWRSGRSVLLCPGRGYRHEADRREESGATEPRPGRDISRPQ
jgi:hypothetical protein